MAIVIYHNPNCGTSRTVLSHLREAGHDPQVVEYLKTPPSADELKGLAARSGGTLRDLVRTKEPLYTELKLDAAETTDAQLLVAMTRHPILINRPIVVTEKGVRLCRPAEKVEEIL